MESDNIILISPNSSMTYNPGEMLEILGKNARMGSSIFISINNAGEVSIAELIVVAKSSGEFYTIWQIPDELESGTYKIIVTDNTTTVSELLIIN
jgi:sulfite reductase alpha subunit-like flavoprotein